MSCTPPPCPDEQEVDVSPDLVAPQEWFLGTPDRWYETPHWRCTHGHVSTRFLKSEPRGAVCLAARCQQPVYLTFPEDTEDCTPTLETVA